MDARRMQHANVRQNAGACGTRAERGSIFEVCIVPTDGTRLPIVGNGEFGMSPFFGQRFGQAITCPCLSRWDAESKQQGLFKRENLRLEVPPVLVGGETTTLRPSNYPLRIVFLSGYNSRDEGSNVSANRAAETGRKGRATTP
jgi:hypothetical protein